MMPSYTRGRTLLLREKTLLRNQQGNGTTGWKWVGGQKAQVSINGTFNATVTVQSDGATVEGPGSDTGSTVGILTKAGSVATAYRVNWIRVDVTNYISGSSNADLLGG